MGQNRLIMKTITILVVCAVYFFSFDACSNSISKQQPAAPAATVSAPKDSVSFISQIQPILQKNCSPCHFTGGKMYERMPFDAAQTLLAHKDGILKRFKQEEENGLLKKYIEQRTAQ